MLDIDGLWETYHHIKKLHELGEDERGNRWIQGTWGASLNKKEISLAIPTYKPLSELCNTGLCYAGWYAVLKGMAVNQSGYVAGIPGRIFVSDWTRASSGLTIEECAELFFSGNTLPSIKEHLIAITGEDRS